MLSLSEVPLDENEAGLEAESDDEVDPFHRFVEKRAARGGGVMLLGSLWFFPLVPP